MVIVWNVARSAPARALALAALAVATSAAVAPAVAVADEWRVTVHHQADNPGETPLLAELRADVPPGDYLLQPASEGEPLRARVFAEGGTRYLATVLPRTRAGRTQAYRMEADTKSEVSPPGVQLRADGPNLDVLVGGHPLTTYRADLPNKPYFYPVVGPTGEPFTRAFPMKVGVEGEDQDHPHQRSFWFTHGSVNGFDFWASDPRNAPNPKFGSIKETSRKTISSGPAVGVLRTTDDWLGPDGSKVCEDERVVRFYDTARVRIIDFDITLKATAGPVTFGDTKEGMFGLRVASSMDVKNKKGGKITNAEGVTDDAAWGKASPWVDYTGPVAGKMAGVAILNHPDSFRYPTTWHVRTYGLFAANPFGWEDFGMKKSGTHVVPGGGSIHFGYRVILHEGDTEAGHVAAAFQAYTKPPTVEVQGE